MAAACCRVQGPHGALCASRHFRENPRTCEGKDSDQQACQKFLLEFKLSRNLILLPAVLA